MMMTKMSEGKVEEYANYLICFYLLLHHFLPLLHILPIPISVLFATRPSVCNYVAR